jgi:hypothetical protein
MRFLAQKNLLSINCASQQKNVEKTPKKRFFEIHLFSQIRRSKKKINPRPLKKKIGLKNSKKKKLNEYLFKINSAFKN